MPEVESFLVETIDPEGPYGAKEAGQGPLLPVIPALNAAVHDALGVWIDEVPVTPEKVLRALESMAKGNAARFGPGAFPAVDFGEPIRVDPPDPHDLRVGDELEAAFHSAGGADAGAAEHGRPRAR
jgi:hypothetical protein